MGETLVNIFYLVRPMMFVESPFTIGGLNFFEFITIMFSLMLVGIAIKNTVDGNKRTLSGIEIAMILFMIWCTAILILYYENTSVKTYIKWILPLVTYMVLKRTINSHEQYIKLIYVLIIGYLIPIIWNFIVIVQGKGLGLVIYWTGLERYEGIYHGVHTMAHNMGFFIMLIALYYVLTKESTTIKISAFKYIILFILVLLALYCIYKSGTRTVYVGLLVFFIAWLFKYNKKLLVLFSIMSVVTILLAAPILKTLFFDVVEAVEGERNIEKAGSGRPYIWKHNLTIYSELGIDRKIAGIGIGTATTMLKDSVWNSHNDYLEALMQTGAIGFLLQLAMYFLIYKKIKKIKTKEAGVYEAIFIAVVVMNMLSNSYISRFGLAQLLFMVLVYIELPAVTKGEIKKINIKQKEADAPRILRTKKVII